MSRFLIAAANTIKAGGLSSMARLVLLVLASHAGKNGNAVWPSQRTLSGETGFSERTIRNALLELQAARKISRKRRYCENGRTSDLIKLHLDVTRGEFGKAGEWIPK